MRAVEIIRKKRDGGELRAEELTLITRGITDGSLTEGQVAAFAMAVLMFALLGFPIAGGAGFFAKWYVIQAALQSSAPQTLLVVVLVLTTVVSAGYYLYVIRVMFMKPRIEGLDVPEPPGGLTRFVLAATVVLLLVHGIVPDYVVRLTWAGRPQLAASSALTDRLYPTPIASPMRTR